MPLGGGDDDGAGRLGGAVVNHLLAEFRVEFDRIIGDQAGLVAGILLLRVAGRSGKQQADRGHHHPGQVTQFRHCKILLGRRPPLLPSFAK